MEHRAVREEDPRRVFLQPLGHRLRALAGPHPDRWAAEGHVAHLAGREPHFVIHPHVSARRRGGQSELQRPRLRPHGGRQVGIPKRDDGLTNLKLDDTFRTLEDLVAPLDGEGDPGRPCIDRLCGQGVLQDAIGLDRGVKDLPPYGRAPRQPF